MRSVYKAIYKSQIFRIPGKILAVEYAVFRRYVFAVPQAVLGGNFTVFQGYVFNVLHGVFAIQLGIFNYYIAAAQKEILGEYRAVVHLKSVTMPARFKRGYLAVFNGGVLAFAEDFYAAQSAALKISSLAVPNGGTGVYVHSTVFYTVVGVVPKGIAQAKRAVAYNEVVAFLKCGLAVGRTLKGAVDNFNVGNIVKFPLFVRNQIFDNSSIFHI